MGSCDASHVQRLLAIRQELGKTSVKKYEAMDKTVCEDDRVRGLTSFMGQLAQGDGREGWCRSKTCPRTIFRILT